MDKREDIGKIDGTMAAIEAVFVQDGRVLAAFYCGSVATGTYDKYSDIDLVLVVADRDRKNFFRKVPRILRQFVGLKSAVNNEAEDNEWCCLVTDDYIGLDLPILTRSDLVPSYKFAGIRIIKDHNRLLHRFKKRCQKIRHRIDHKRFVNDIEDMKNAQLYFARHIARGQLVEAMSDCSRVGEELMQWLVKLKGVRYQPPTLRDVDKVLSVREMNLFLRARPKNPSAPEIRISMKALWKLTLYVIAVYEQKTGRKFPKSYDEDEFLKLIEAVYKGRRF